MWLRRRGGAVEVRTIFALIFFLTHDFEWRQPSADKTFILWLALSCRWQAKGGIQRLFKPWNEKSIKRLRDVISLPILTRIYGELWQHQRLLSAQQITMPNLWWFPIKCVSEASVVLHTAHKNISLHVRRAPSGASMAESTARNSSRAALAVRLFFNLNFALSSHSLLLY